MQSDSLEGKFVEADQEDLIFNDSHSNGVGLISSLIAKQGIAGMG